MADFGSRHIAWTSVRGFARVMELAREGSRSGRPPAVSHFAESRVAAVGRTLRGWRNAGLQTFFRSPPSLVSRSGRAWNAIAGERLAGQAAPIRNARNPGSYKTNRTTATPAGSRRQRSAARSILHRAPRNIGSHRRRSIPRRLAPRPVAARAAEIVGQPHPVGRHLTRAS